MEKLSNNAGLSLAMAVWLAHDEYTNGAAQHPGKNLISATSLLKSTRSIVLSHRMPQVDGTTDVSDLIPSRFGHAMHDSIEKAWTEGYEQAMLRLGLPKKMIDKVRINPDPSEITEDMITVFLEQRFFKPVFIDGNEVVVSGKFDQVINGEINDTKTTSVWAYVNRTKDEDHKKQLSIYRWLCPEYIQSDVAKIQFIFTDWQRAMVRANKNYPASRVVEYNLELLSERETEKFVKEKIREIAMAQDMEEEDLPPCTPKELWMSDPVYKYYANPEKAKDPKARSTRNFDTYPEAAQHCSKAGKGVVITVESEAKACGYCAASPICSQYKALQKAQS